MANAPSVADLTNALRGVDSPAGKAELKKQAQSNNAPDEIVSAIEILPDDKFDTMADVTRPYGEEDTSQVSDGAHGDSTEPARKGGKT